MSSEQLKKEYLIFFDDFNIDSNTGELRDYTNQKFATMPYIGSKYVNANYKILFVGQDIGADETPGRIQSFEERRMAIEKDCCYNPHIAGTYSSALFLLKDYYEWKDVWNKHREFSTYSQATKHILHKDGENPLSFITLTNLHKFVTVERQHRAGKENREFLKRETEENILLKEIEALKPNLIFFQGKLPSHSTIEKIKLRNIEITKARHPSYREKGGRKPDVYIKTFSNL